MELGNIDNSRTVEQAAHMQRTVGSGKCPFCDGDGFNPEINKVIWFSTHWRAWFNPFDYPYHQKHIVIAAQQHVTDITKLTSGAWEEWGTVNRELISKFELPGGGLVMRFGNNSLNAGTLTHVHSHIQVPDGTGPAMAVFYKDEHFAKFLEETKERYNASKIKV